MLTSRKQTGKSQDITSLTPAPSMIRIQNSWCYGCPGPGGSQSYPQFLFDTTSSVSIWVTAGSRFSWPSAHSHEACWAPVVSRPEAGSTPFCGGWSGFDTIWACEVHQPGLLKQKHLGFGLQSQSRGLFPKDPKGWKSHATRRTVFNHLVAQVTCEKSTNALNANVH